MEGGCGGGCGCGKVNMVTGRRVREGGTMKLSRERVKLLNLLSSFLLLNGGQNLPPVVVRSSREVVYIIRIIVQALWGNIVKVKVKPSSNVWA